MPRRFDPEWLDPVEEWERRVHGPQSNDGLSEEEIARRAAQDEAVASGRYAAAFDPHCEICLAMARACKKHQVLHDRPELAEAQDEGFRALAAHLDDLAWCEECEGRGWVLNAREEHRACPVCNRAPLRPDPVTEAGCRELSRIAKASNEAAARSWNHPEAPARPVFEIEPCVPLSVQAMPLGPRYPRHSSEDCERRAVGDDKARGFWADYKRRGDTPGGRAAVSADDAAARAFWWGDKPVKEGEHDGA